MFAHFKAYCFWLLAFILTVLLLATSLQPLAVRADEVEDLQKQINDLNKSLGQSQAATKPLEGELVKLRIQLAQIQTKLDVLSSNINQKEKDLKVREDKIATQQVLLGSRVRSYYIRSYLSSPFIFLLSSSTSGDIFRELSLKEAATREDQRVISQVTEDMVKLIAEKEKLEADKKSLAIFQAQVDKNASFLGGEVKKAKDFQATLSNQIAELSAKQQAILAAKTGSFTTTVGDVPLADDPRSRPDFNPGFSPAFAMFSFGAFTHKNGMSQYGAKGRAESGQSAEDILRFYYPGANINKSYSVPGSITVQGFGSIPFEDVYMKRIYEMPNSFPKEALKAQAVAARTFALRYTGNGASSICTTEACQVYKNDNKGGAWEEAVNATRGWVLEGGPNAQYSSTTGGYSNNSGWDTKCGNQGCWTGDAYERLASSPWFYKSWFTQSYVISSSTCGRGHPWLTSEEMADILNAWVVLIKNGQSDDRVTPAGDCWGGNSYSLADLRSKAGTMGGGYSSVSGASVTYSTNGSTAQITFQTDLGSVTINGSDFKKAFNLRAPGYISIKSSLYNIEKK